MSRGPLAAVRVVITRPRAQAASLVELLEAAGAIVAEVPVIEIVDPADGGLMLRGALRALGRGDWLTLTSANGADRVAIALGDGRLQDGVRVAAVGPATRERLESHQIQVDLVPERSIAEGLLQVFPGPPVTGGRVLLARAERARDQLPIGLRLMGWSVDDVTAYRTIPVTVGDEGAAACREADVVAFTSGSTVSNLVAAVGVDGLPPLVATIGPATGATATALGVDVAIEASTHTIQGLVDALTAHFETRRP